MQDEKGHPGYRDARIVEKVSESFFLKVRSIDSGCGHSSELPSRNCHQKYH